MASDRSTSISLPGLLRRWLPLVLLIVLAFGAWGASQAADTDDASVTPIAYDNQLGTPLLSARRIPETLQAPIADDAVAPAIRSFIADLQAAQPDLQTCLVVEVDGRVLIDEGANLALIPASNQKLITTYAALEVLPLDTQFTTRVSRVAEITDGVLDGDIYFVGGGDPFLVTDAWRTQYIQRDEEGNVVEPTYPRAWTRLEDLADQIAATGLTSVTGSIVADESLFDSVRVGPWAERLVLQNQSGPLTALAVNEGFVSWADNSPTFSARTQATDPALHSANVLRQLLTDRGITVGGTVVGQEPAGVVDVASLASAPLIDIVTHVNSWSNNYGAEILLKHIGLVMEGEGSTAAGARAVTAVLGRNPNFDLEGIDINDGSGLSEDDRLTCGLLNEILKASGIDSPLAQSLSIGGERGSLALRHVDTDADGNVFAKTGTLNPSTALSGFVISADEPDTVLTFAYISNAELVASTVREVQEPFIEDLTEFPEAPTTDELDPLEPIPLS